MAQPLIKSVDNESPRRDSYNEELELQQIGSDQADSEYLPGNNDPRIRVPLVPPQVPGVPPQGLVPGVPPQGLVPRVPPQGLVPRVPPQGLVPRVPPQGLVPRVPRLPPGTIMVTKQFVIKVAIVLGILVTLLIVIAAVILYSIIINKCMPDDMNSRLNTLKTEMYTVQGYHTDSDKTVKAILKTIETLQQKQGTSDNAVTTLQQNIQSLQQKHKKETAVAFSARIPSGSMIGYTPLFSDTFVTSDGSYSKSTGKFKCPVAGIYIFSITIRTGSNGSASINCYLRVNGINKQFVSAHRDDYDMSSVTEVISLDKDNMVELYCSSGWEHVTSAAAFYGVLVTPT